MVLLISVWEFMKTVYKQTVCMFTTERKSMSGDEYDDWIYDIIPAKQVEEIEYNAENLQRNLNNGINVVLSATNDSAIRLCKAYNSGIKGNINAWVHVMGFLESLIETIENHLDDEGIDPYAK